MTEYDYWKIFPKMPRKVTLADITIRDGFQHLEKFISTEAKNILRGKSDSGRVQPHRSHQPGKPLGHAPVHGTPKKFWPIFDSDRFKEKCAKAGINYQDLVSSRRSPSGKSAVDRAIELKEKGIGPDRILMMVSTEEKHHFANSGCTLPEYWKEARTGHQKGQRCRDQDVRDGQHHLGKPHRRRHGSEGRGGIHQALV